MKRLPTSYSWGAPFGALGLLEDMFHKGVWTDNNTEAAVYSPALDIAETETEYRFSLNVPGFTKEQVNLSVEDGILTICATKSEQHEESDERYHQRERWSGSLTRKIRLPKGVSAEAIAAQLEHGVLILTLPKSEETRSRTIEIN